MKWFILFRVLEAPTMFADSIFFWASGRAELHHETAWLSWNIHGMAVQKVEKTKYLLRICPLSCGWLCARNLWTKSTLPSTLRALTEDVKDTATLSDLVMCISSDSCCFCWHPCLLSEKNEQIKEKSPWYAYFRNSIVYRKMFFH